MSSRDLVISVVTPHRTLDFSVDDYDTFSVLLRALRTLVQRERAGIRITPRLSSIKSDEEMMQSMLRGAGAGVGSLGGDGGDAYAQKTPE
mmetsp:Transcript_43862/g.137828  ORF Transcript_43862/g.137828 Transcript_43862/m.137828 type:complete len:90 (+) Transcript_43862:589-858(+)